MSDKLYPLKFTEVIQNYDFGNRKIPEMFPEKDLPADQIIAETWEITAHPDFPGRVINGPLTGKTLSELTAKYGKRLLGKKIEKKYGKVFPLLLKFLDARETLEVQVHPEDSYAKTFNLDQLGKPESWYILEADPGAFLYWGTKEGVSYRDLRGVGPDENGFLDYLMKVRVKPGVVFHVPPGRIHAIGGGIVLFELQQTSDVTLGPDYLFSSGGKLEGFDSHRALDMFMEQLDIEEIPKKNATVPPVSVEDGDNLVTYLLASKYFAMEKLELTSRYVHTNRGKNKFFTLTALQGRASIETDSREVELPSGRSALIPASIREFNLRPYGGPVKLLKCYIPDLKTDIVEPLQERGVDRTKITALGGPGRRNDLRSFLEDRGNE